MVIMHIVSMIILPAIILASWFYYIKSIQSNLVKITISIWALYLIFCIIYFFLWLVTSDPDISRIISVIAFFILLTVILAILSILSLLKIE